MNSKLISEEISTEIKNCESCLIYQYHAYLLPKKIATKAEKERDKILTAVCNACNKFSNFVDKNKHKLTDELILRIKKELISKGVNLDDNSKK